MSVLKRGIIVIYLFIYLFDLYSNREFSFIESRKFKNRVSLSPFFLSFFFFLEIIFKWSGFKEGGNLI